MRNFATALYALRGAAAAAGGDDTIGLCSQVMKTDANPVYTDFCMDQCSFWASEYGQAYCGASVATNSDDLINCVYKMNAGCRNSIQTTAPPKPTEKPATQTTKIVTTTTTPSTTTVTTTTLPATTLPATTLPATTLPATTLPATTLPATTVTVPATTLPATTVTVPATTLPATTVATTTTAKKTTAPGPKPEHKLGAPGMWFPDDAPMDNNSGSSSIVGPNGECILSYDGASDYPAGSYVGVGNKIYKNKWYAGSADVPGNGEPWDYVQDCTGSAPEVMSVEKMIQMVETPDEPTMFYGPWSPPLPTVNEGHLKEQELLATIPNLQTLKDAFRVLSREEIEKITPGAATNPENVKRVESFIKPLDWFKFFPFHHESYSYENYLKAVGAFPDYCKTYSDGRDSDKICKKLVAASFAHYAQETGANASAWSLDVNDAPPQNTHEEARQFYGGSEPIPLHFQGLYWLREVAFSGPGGEDATTSTYESCDPSSDLPWAEFYPCSKKHTYFGRGSKQLSWNFNYGMFSEDMFGDALELLEEPALVADTWLNFASGIWFAVTPQSPKPSMVWALDGTWEKNAVDSANGLVPGFGSTIMIINGSYECGKESPQAANRERCYKALMEAFGETIPDDEPTNCQNMKPFGENSPASMPLYWNKDWQSMGCVVGNVQTPFRISRDGDFQKCADWYWRSYVIYQNTLIGQNGEKVW